MQAKNPEEGDFVVGRIKEIKSFGAFVSLDEYPQSKGLVHLREVAPGRIRSIRDYIRENQRVVGKVIGVDPQRNYVDLSLRNITKYQKNQAVKEWKDLKRARKLFESVAEAINKKEADCYKAFGNELIEKYGGLYSAFEAAVLDPEEFEKDFKGEWVKSFVEEAKQNIQIPSVTIKGDLSIVSHAPDGISKIKALCKSLEKEEEDAKVSVRYVSAPVYRISVNALNYKIAEAELSEAIAKAKEQAKQVGTLGFKRRGK
jgi:translation initiation factor 2 subunit 1